MESNISVKKYLNYINLGTQYYKPDCSEHSVSTNRYDLKTHSVETTSARRGVGGGEGCGRPDPSWILGHEVPVVIQTGR